MKKIEEKRRVEKKGKNVQATFRKVYNFPLQSVLCVCVCRLVCGADEDVMHFS